MNTAVAGLVTGLALGFAGYFGGFGAFVVVAVVGAAGLAVGCLARGDVRFSDFRFTRDRPGSRDGRGTRDGFGPGRDGYRAETGPGRGSGSTGPRPQSGQWGRVR
jgi:hypothetical protein